MKPESAGAAENVDELDAAFAAQDWTLLLALCEQLQASGQDTDGSRFLTYYALRELGRLDDARALLDAIDVSIKPSRWGKAFRNLASGFADAGRAAEAIPLYCRSIELLPDHATALIFLGEAYAHTGNLAEAKDCFQRATACSVGDLEEAWLNLGGVQLGLGQLAEAEQSFLRSLEIDPKCEDARRALARIRTGEFGRGPT